MHETPWVDVGGVRIWCLNDGQIPASDVPGPDGVRMLEVNAFLIRSRGRLILVDTGFGTKWLDDEPDLRRPTGSVAEALATAGFDADAVDTVVNTHLHVDHAGGDTDFDVHVQAEAAFPNAEYLIQAAEWAHAVDPPPAWKHLFRRDDFVPLEGGARLRLIVGRSDVTDEVSCIPAPGHTPGHQVVRVESAGQAALLVGDAVPEDRYLSDPNVPSERDVDPELAVETRATLLAWSRERSAWLGLAHAGTTLRRVANIAAPGAPGWTST